MVISCPCFVESTVRLCPPEAGKPAYTVCCPVTVVRGELRRWQESSGGAREPIIANKRAATLQCLKFVSSHPLMNEFQPGPLSSPTVPLRFVVACMLPSLVDKSQSSFQLFYQQPWAQLITRNTSFSQLQDTPPAWFSFYSSGSSSSAPWPLNMGCAPDWVLEPLLFCLYSSVGGLILYHCISNTINLLLPRSYVSGPDLAPKLQTCKSRCSSASPFACLKSVSHVPDQPKLELLRVFPHLILLLWSPSQ